MKYYFSSAGYIVTPDFRKLARVKETKIWRENAQNIVDELNEGASEAIVLERWQESIE